MGFKLKSGNITSFKSMGSSPIKQSAVKKKAEDIPEITLPEVKIEDKKDTYIPTKVKELKKKEKEKEKPKKKKKEDEDSLLAAELKKMQKDRKKKEKKDKYYRKTKKIINLLEKSGLQS